MDELGGVELDSQKEQDEPGSSLRLMFSRVEQIYFRMGPLIVGRKGRISLACVYF